MSYFADTTPPKGVLSKESRLFETNCIPSALLHFGSDDNQTNFLKEDILQKVSSPKASLMQALIDRYDFLCSINLKIWKSREFNRNVFQTWQ